jgi:predicted small lipoprotein YifL
MREDATAGIVILAATLAGFAACGPRGPKAPGREVVTPLLQQEANSLKASGEKLDPVLGVKATWAIAGIDVTERPNDPDRPWAGAIRFRIRSETKDTDGAVVVDEFDRRFDYVYSATLGKWIFQLAPSPAPGP